MGYCEEDNQTVSHHLVTYVGLQSRPQSSNPVAATCPPLPAGMKPHTTAEGQACVFAHTRRQQADTKVGPTL